MASSNSNVAVNDPQALLDGQAKLLRSARRGRIVVVDDDALVRRAVQRSLASEHDVTALSSAREVLERIGAGERFDIIVCDLMMPGMTGMDLHAELSKVAPELAERMVFLTGGVFTARAQDFLDRVPNLRLEKPFKAVSFRALLRDRIR
ncbi:MAG: Sensory box histidine kinase/response regulator [Labilithrix sp.]|nr:Sensory box histidine kinase/response regulator [Labilithrix sp.]